MRTTLSAICLLIILLSISEINGSVTMGIYKDDDFPGKCVVDIDEGLVLDKDEFITRHCLREKCYQGPIVISPFVIGAPRNCQKILCLDEGRVHFIGCLWLDSYSNCTLGEAKNPEAEHMACCNHVVHCPNGDTTFYG